MCKLLLVTVFHHSNTALTKTLLQRLVLLKSHPVCAGMEEKGVEDKTTPIDSSRALERVLPGFGPVSLCYLHNSSFVMIIFNLGQPTAERLF